MTDDLPAGASHLHQNSCNMPTSGSDAPLQIVVVGRFANATANGEPFSRVSVVWFLKIVMWGSCCAYKGVPCHGEEIDRVELRSRNNLSGISQNTPFCVFPTFDTLIVGAVEVL